MRPRDALFRFQSYAAARMVEERQLAMLVKPGYGKTATALTALADLGQWPALVVGPSRVAEMVWGEEAAAWAHTSNLLVNPIMGTEKQRKKKLLNDAHIETISYESLFWLSTEVELSRRYRAIVFDELSKMKAAGTKRYMRLRHVAKEIPIRFGLTGSPVPNHLLDVWGQMFMVAGEKPLGPRFVDYRKQYFAPADYMQRTWELKHPSYEEEIHRRIAPYVYALPPQPEVQLPPVVVHPINLALPLNVKFIVENLAKDLFAKLPSGAEIEALSASAVAGKVRQMSSGAVFVDRDKDQWEEVHTAKIEALHDKLDELQGQPALIAYWYTHELARLSATLKKRKCPWGVLQSRADVERWNRGELEALLIHPQGAGHGLNLQFGGSTVIWFEIPWSPELWNQVHGRLARSGQKTSHIDSYPLICGPADEYVVSVLELKNATEQRLFDNLIAFQQEKATSRSPAPTTCR